MDGLFLYLITSAFLQSGAYLATVCHAPMMLYYIIYQFE